MVYEFFYKAKAEPDRNYDITYCIIKENNSYYIESSIDGSHISETASLGNCGEEKAVFLAKLMAKKSVRPLHIEDIISDLRF